MPSHITFDEQEGGLMFNETRHDPISNTIESKDVSLPYSVPKLAEYDKVCSSQNFMDDFTRELQAKITNESITDHDQIMKTALALHQKMYLEQARKISGEVPALDTKVFDHYAQKQRQIGLSASYLKLGTTLKDRDAEHPRKITGDKPEEKGAIALMVLYDNPLLTSYDRNKLATAEARFQNIINGNDNRLGKLPDPFVRENCTDKIHTDGEKKYMQETNRFPQALDVTQLDPTLPQSRINTRNGGRAEMMESFTSGTHNGHPVFTRQNIDCLVQRLDWVENKVPVPYERIDKPNRPQPLKDYYKKVEDDKLDDDLNKKLNAIA
ncbi:MAG: hypothetical protein V4543_07805 [Bacteroidota bacterium]